MLQVSILVQLIFNAREVNSFNKTYLFVSKRPLHQRVRGIVVIPVRDQEVQPN